MTGIRIGTCGSCAGFDVVELNVTTVARAHVTVPEGVEVTLKTRLREFGDTPEIHRRWKRTLEVARTLDATFIVVQSPRGFRPTDDDVASVVEFFRWAHRDGIRLGWEPHGDAWTDDIVRDLCRELSLTHVVDPFVREPVRGRPPYFRLTGAGAPNHRYTDDELVHLHGLCTAERPMYDSNSAYCVFGNASMREDAERLRAMLASA